ncbi:ABC transporter permease [Anaerosacchariphilus sp. NSJ-68]|uniref:ABC transporter permease n=1 Tax=Anaerosacchariphilus hominis TaxID=2763017 RepID=A0A923RN14_9FIRM|nr:ABC transporter permease [Anaerosacchariphilus hominis]MBC5660907.1 ABC transporter permease [Anaerosacchariphilus hominis]
MRGQKTVKRLGYPILKQKAFLATVAILVIMIFPKTGFYTSYNLIELLKAAAVLEILAFGVTLTVICGGCDLSIGSTMSLSGIIAILLMSHVPMWIAILAGIASGAVIGFINGFFIVQQKTEPFIITLGTGMVIKGVCQQLTDAKPIAPDNPMFVKLANGLAFGFLPNVILVTIILMILFHLLLRYTAFGRNCYAIGGGYDVALYSGINVIKTKWMTYVICGMTAAAGGIMLSSQLNTGSSIYGDNTALLVNCGVVVGGTSFAGGIGGIPQTAIGLLLFSVLENAMNSLMISPYIQQATKGVLIVLIIWLDCYTIKRKNEAV